MLCRSVSLLIPYELFRASHSHNSSHHSHIVKLSLHFYAHVGACPKFFHPPACKHAWAQTFVHWYQYSTLSLVF
ncbi:hypothetical protein RJD28_13170 [Oscillospiraceae bacterium NTUH-002-81]|nr:hypothetical protein RJD28_13170 [Oscillospiraceae bacterium NTUH-002-81]